MVRNIVILGGNSHPAFVSKVCEFLGVPPAQRVLTKFSSGETRCEIQDSVRGKDVYIIQSFGSANDTPFANGVNDFFIELCIMVSACKMGSAKRVTAVLPIFPYSRQPDLPYVRAGAPRRGVQQGSVDEHGSVNGVASAAGSVNGGTDTVPATPGPNIPRTDGLDTMLDSATLAGAEGTTTSQTTTTRYTTHDYENASLAVALQSKSHYKQWSAQAGSLVADLLTCSGADRVVTCDLHESSYQGFFDIPVDNLFGRKLLQQYIRLNIENWRDAVIVSPDAGGAKRATAIADNLGMPFALIHKERRTTNFTERQKATMMLVGDVSERVCILIDDLIDTGNTIIRAAKLLKKEGAVKVYALLTHGIFSGDALARINASAVDRVVVTNTVAQDRHLAALCPKLEVLDISTLFAEAIRRVHHGESISVLFRDELV
ncbi:ribose-phosphate pyrophosphokinase 5 [Rhypophila decipiens]|uniref:Ribose-phosphate pyrophosphokinase 5 n=1 Tax=Rhypophila decipiens TaxID=261697 RepID=A0AAN6YJD1_9PEZI|nr:ribose-phosphate pyrophosphokinase 5 [Rhypophila decipiens]